MSSDSDVMRAVLAGNTPDRKDFEAYYRGFHDVHRGATETALAQFVDERSRNSYDRLADAIDLGSGERVLDIGCGDGVLLERLNVRRPEIRVSGVDLSESEIARAASRVPAGNVDELISGSAEALPFAAGAFDAVVSHMVLMLLPDVAAVIKEVRRVLREGGSFVFLIPRPGNPEEPAAQMLCAVTEWVREIHPAFAPVFPGDPRVFSIEALTALLNESGFPNVAFDDFTVSRDVSPKELHALLEQRYYIGSLPPATRAHVNMRVDEWASDRTFTYTEAIRIVEAR